MPFLIFFFFNDAPTTEIYTLSLHDALPICTTFTTLADSRLTVFATAPPQPASNDFASTRAFVPGGPEPRTNGLGNFMPLTVMDRSMMFSVFSLPPVSRTCRAGGRGRIATCCALRESCRDRDRQRQARLYRAALPLQTARADRRSNSARRTLRCPTDARDRYD